jgi:mannosyltransferase OCH1-like enzyme
MIKKLKEIYINATELPLQPVQKRMLAKKQLPERAIPAVVYQTWESNFFCKTHAQGIEHFRELNPDMEFNLYDNKDLDEYMEESYGKHPIYQIYKKAKFGPMKADIFRYCILYEKGGYYFDIKSYITKPISEICPANYRGLISFERWDTHIPPEGKALFKVQHTTKYILNWGMGFAKGHRVPERMIDSICENYSYYKDRVFENPKQAILSYTGPGKFTQIVREEIGRNETSYIYQSGVDFEGHGVYSMKRAELRFFQTDSYKKNKNAKIVD